MIFISSFSTNYWNALEYGKLQMKCCWLQFCTQRQLMVPMVNVSKSVTRFCSVVFWGPKTKHAIVGINRARRGLRSDSLSYPWAHQIIHEEATGDIQPHEFQRSTRNEWWRRQRKEKRAMSKWSNTHKLCNTTPKCFVPNEKLAISTNTKRIPLLISWKNESNRCKCHSQRCVGLKRAWT